MKSSVAYLSMLLLSMLGTAASAQNTSNDEAMQSCPMHKRHAAETSHHATVEKLGDQAMGFPHDKTTHHFRIAAVGGAIEVTANNPNDQSNTEAIRSHLSHIAIMFRNGDFSTPMFVHDGVPPGITTMKILKTAIRFKFEEIPAGGRVRIESSDPVALAAIHDFLRFQISDHNTGDDLTEEETH